MSVIAAATADDLRWIVLRGGLRLPGFDHWRERSSSKPSDPDDIRWDCSCGYAGSPETVERHWAAMLGSEPAQLVDRWPGICEDHLAHGPHQITENLACPGRPERA